MDNILLIVISSLIIYTLLFMDNNAEKERKLGGKKKRVEQIKEGFISSNKPDYKYRYPKKEKKMLSQGINVDKLVKDVIQWQNSSANVTQGVVNPNFLDIQWHNDYRDVITAFHNLVPDKRQRFNLANIPLVYSEPEVDEVGPLVNDFLHVLNENVNSEVPNERHKNTGWDEAVVDPNVKETGWDKVQKSLGLTPSLFDKPAGKCTIKLIAIQYVQKYETEDEVKYVVELVLQKANVADQVLIKCSFVQDKRPLHDENNFHVTKTVQTKVIVEDIFVSGYLSHEGNDARLTFDGEVQKFYDYDNLEKNNMTDPKHVQKILMEKYRQRTEEMEQRNAMLDEEGQNFHRELPHIYDFSNIKATRTIFDDMNEKKLFI